MCLSDCVKVFTSVHRLGRIGPVGWTARLSTDGFWA
jgi:hypothetical protein